MKLSFLRFPGFLLQDVAVSTARGSFDEVRSRQKMRRLFPPADLIVRQPSTFKHVITSVAPMIRSTNILEDWKSQWIESWLFVKIVYKITKS